MNHLIPCHLVRYHLSLFTILGGVGMVDNGDHDTIIGVSMTSGFSIDSGRVREEDTFA